MSHLVAVTGATGNIGHALSEQLLRQDHRVRAIGRHADRLAPLVALGAEACVGDLDDSAFVAEAFEGVDAVFAMIPPNYTSPDIRVFQRLVGRCIADGLKKADLPPTLALSSIGGGLPSGTGVVAGLHEFEESLKALSGLPLVILRPGYFMENHLGSIHTIQSQGINASALRGDISIPMIATEDIARVAAEILADPKNIQGQSIRELLGPRDYSYREATNILGTAIGLPNLAYQTIGYEAFRKQMSSMGVTSRTADSFIEMYEAFNTGWIPRTLNRTRANTTPTTLEEWGREIFAPAFRQSELQAA